MLCSLQHNCTLASVESRMHCATVILDALGALLRSAACGKTILTSSSKGNRRCKLTGRETLQKTSTPQRIDSWAT